VIRIQLTEVKKRRLAAQQKFQCAGCVTMLTDTWCIDHRVPLHLGGSNELCNLQVLCPNCHAKKTQDEMIRIGEKRIERVGQQSRFFDPMSIDFIGVASLTTKSVPYSR